jgi:hypothetical protein
MNEFFSKFKKDKFDEIIFRNLMARNTIVPLRSNIKAKKIFKRGREGKHQQ